MSKSFLNSLIFFQIWKNLVERINKRFLSVPLPRQTPMRSVLLGTVTVTVAPRASANQEQSASTGIRRLWGERSSQPEKQTPAASDWAITTSAGISARTSVRTRHIAKGALVLINAYAFTVAFDWSDHGTLMLEARTQAYQTHNLLTVSPDSQHRLVGWICSTSLTLCYRIKCPLNAAQSFEMCLKLVGITRKSLKEVTKLFVYGAFVCFCPSGTLMVTALPGVTSIKALRSYGNSVPCPNVLKVQLYKSLTSRKLKCF